MAKLITEFIDGLGAGLIFLGQILNTLVRRPPTRAIVYEQIWKVTAQSFATTALAGFFVGAIMTVQFTLQVKEFGALGFLGGLATSATIREIGPLLIAFMLSGKVGAFTSAELGTMRVTEQIDAIRCLGADPMQEIIVPRFVAIIVSSFSLLAAGLMMSIFGGLLMGMAFSGINPEEYVRHIPSLVVPVSIVGGLFKCLVFAIVLGAVCTFKGFHTSGGAKGVGRAVVSTAVTTMVGIVVFDWLTSYLTDVVIKMVVT